MPVTLHHGGRVNVEIPEVVDAEEELVGGTLLFRDGYDTALRHCSPHDLYSPRLKKILEAVPHGWAAPRSTQPSPEDLRGWWSWDPARKRTEVVAQRAGVTVEEVERLRDNTAGQIERAARRVADAARRRAAMAIASAIFNQIGQRSSLEEIRPLVDEMASLVECGGADVIRLSEAQGDRAA